MKNKQEDRLKRAVQMAADIKHKRKRGRRHQSVIFAEKREREERRKNINEWVGECQKKNWWKTVDLTFMGELSPEREASERAMLKERGASYMEELKFITDYNAKTAR